MNAHWAQLHISTSRAQALTSDINIQVSCFYIFFNSSAVSEITSHKKRPKEQNSIKLECHLLNTNVKYCECKNEFNFNIESKKNIVSD